MDMEMLQKFELKMENFLKFGKDLKDADEVIYLDENLVIPPYVDAHLHLDYYMIGKTDEVENESGNLF